GFPGRNAGLDQHLFFPIAGALGIVSLSAVLGDADFAQYAIGPQAEVHAIALPIGGVGGKQGDILIGDLLVKLFIGDARGTVGLAVAAVDEHQIDVGAIVQLLAAQFAERDHGEAAGAAI